MTGCPVAADTARYYANQDRAERAYERAIENARDVGCPDCGADLADEPDARDWLACASQAVTVDGPCEGGVRLDRLIDAFGRDDADAADEARVRNYEED